MGLKEPVLSMEAQTPDELFEAITLLTCKYNCKVTLPVHGMERPVYENMIRLLEPVQVRVRWQTLTDLEKKVTRYNPGAVPSALLFSDLLHFERFE